ncbi:RsfA family transcriptional regulator [Bacillus manliponensis]|uniref:RsfA family transcriptional regulator n=1 Tax=Bacillus manliponensis TaxID=574376 RepID=UPI00351806C1
MKMRQDAWTTEEDLLLAETVLRHIREGSTQLNAFDEVGDKLNRTAAACGFRWNAEVRQNYEEAVQIAKKQRKERKRAEGKKEKEQLANIPEQNVHSAKTPEEHAVSPLTTDDVISFLQQLEENPSHIASLQAENETLRGKLESLQKENHELEKELAQLQKNQQAVQEDYATLIRIMDRARKLVISDEPTEEMAPIFQTDANGNLDIVYTAEN